LPKWYSSLALSCINNLDDNISHRQKISQIYSSGLNKKVFINNIESQISNSTCLRFPILVNDRASIIEQLKTHGVHVSDIWYDAPIAPEKYLSKTNYNHECPNAEKISKLMLNLPTHINVSLEEAKKIVKIINDPVRSG